jgi:hypothetical protein
MIDSATLTGALALRATTNHKRLRSATAYASQEQMTAQDAHAADNNRDRAWRRDGGGAFGIRRGHGQWLRGAPRIVLKNPTMKRITALSPRRASVIIASHQNDMNGEDACYRTR